MWRPNRLPLVLCSDYIVDAPRHHLSGVLIFIEVENVLLYCIFNYLSNIFFSHPFHWSMLWNSWFGLIETGFTSEKTTQSFEERCYTNCIIVSLFLKKSFIENNPLDQISSCLRNLNVCVCIWWIDIVLCWDTNNHQFPFACSQIRLLNWTVLCSSYLTFHVLLLQIRPYVGCLVQYLPLLWKQSEEHNMLRCAILTTLIHLVQVCCFFFFFFSF